MALLLRPLSALVLASFTLAISACDVTPTPAELTPTQHVEETPAMTLTPLETVELTSTLASATVTPTPPPTATNTPTNTPELVSASACDHIYLPLRIGARWTYNYGGGEVTYEITDVTSGIGVASGIMSIDRETRPRTFYCDSNGIYSYPGLKDDSLPINFSRLFPLPPDDRLSLGYSWASEEDDTDQASIGASFHRVYVVEGEDNIRISTESLNALLVSYTYVYSPDPRLTDPTMALQSDGIVWLAKGVGIIREELFIRQANNTLFTRLRWELTAYHIP